MFRVAPVQKTFVFLFSFLALGAQAYAQAAPPRTPSLLETLFPLILVFVIFYFFIIRPQSKKAKTQEKFISELKRGDEIVLSGGLLGRIDALSEKVVTVEIAPGTKIQVLRRHVAGTQAQFNIKL